MSSPDLLKRLAAMNTFQKMMEALMGEPSARNILVRDRNRVVWSAVLDSPLLTDTELERIAGMSEVSPQVLRAIAGNRSWVARHGVCLALLMNPMTPYDVLKDVVAQMPRQDVEQMLKDATLPAKARHIARKLMEAASSGEPQAN